MGDQAQQRRDQALRLEAAQKAREKEEATFKLYDADDDGMLDEIEIASYCKGEYGFDLVKEKLAHIMKTDAVKMDKEKGKPGTKWENFMSLKSQLNIVREEIRAKQRKIDEAASAERSKEQLKIVTKNIAETVTAVEIFEAEVIAVEKKAQPCWQQLTNKGRGPPLGVLEDMAEEIERAADAAKDFWAAATEQVQGLAIGIKEDKPEQQVIIRIDAEV